MFHFDSLLFTYWKQLREYVCIRRELRADLEARAMRKADEYAYDCLTWKVFKVS